VWAGGGMIPVERQAYIMTWPLHNPGWQVRIWYDGQNLLTDERNRTIKGYFGEKVAAGKGKTRTAVKPWVWKTVEQEIGAGGDEATIRYLQDAHYHQESTLRKQRMDTFDQLLSFCDKYGMGLFDVNDLGNFSRSRMRALYNAEMTGNAYMGTNYGATSDIVRIMILLEHGGLYVDSDVFCVLALDDIKAHPEYPRFGVTDINLYECYGKTATGMKPHQWLSNELWYDRFARIGQLPAITNSIIAAHPRSPGLKSYKRKVIQNYASATAPDVNTYVTPGQFRSTTIQMTGPTGATEGVAYDKQVRDAQYAYGQTLAAMTPTSQRDAAQALLQELLRLRDNLYFPMYHVVDVYGHEWMKE
jgi:hypothetical protein